MAGVGGRAGSAAAAPVEDMPANTASVGDRSTALAGQAFDDRAGPGGVVDSLVRPEV